MSAWTGEEKFDCYCGKPAAVIVKDGETSLFCFAHTYGAGLWAPLPKEKPDDWDDGPLRAEALVLYDAGEKEHPTVLAYFAARQRVRDILEVGYLEGHPAVPPFLEQHRKLVGLNEAGLEDSPEAEEVRSGMDVLWDALDEEEQQFVRHAAKAAPAWRPDPEED